MLCLVVLCAPTLAVHAQEAGTGASAAAPNEQSGETDTNDRDARTVERLGDTVGGDNGWQVELPQGLNDTRQRAPARPQVTLPDPELSAALQDALTATADGADGPARQRLNTLMAELVERAERRIEAGDPDIAARYVGAIRQLQPDRPALAQLERRLESARGQAERLQRGKAALEQGRLIAPPADNARSAFEAVLERDPDNAQALEGLAAVRSALVAQALELGRQMQFDRARRVLDTAAELPGTASVDEARTSLKALRAKREERLRTSVQQHIDDQAYDRAASVLDELVALGASDGVVATLRERLKRARAHGGFEPGEVFRDTYAGGSARGPEMVVVPAGSFMMGAPPQQRPRSRYETPYHRVTFERGFAIARTEITVGEFRRFVQATGYRTEAELGDGSRVYDPRRNRMRRMDDANWRLDYAGRPAGDELPVVHVSWHDATAYAEWLARVTGQPYRLPSEAEFEYALRAGSRTGYWWGDGAPPRDSMANVTGEGDVSPTRQRWSDAFEDYSDGYWGPAPVGSMAANAFGLYDMGGNVKEWVADCWHDGYRRAPSDGSAWLNPGCARRVVRGGDWASAPDETFSSVRVSGAARTRMPRLGFRVARDL